jgi:hypothetical protein
MRISSDIEHSGGVLGSGNIEEDDHEAVGC